MLFHTRNVYSVCMKKHPLGVSWGCGQVQIGGGPVNLCKPKKTRLNLDLKEDMKDRLLYLTADIQSPSLTETIRRAVTLCYRIAHHQKRGGKFIFRSQDGSEEVLTFL